MAVTPTTWNPSDKHTDLTLSNGNKTAWSSVNNQFENVRSIFGASTGKFYVEVTVDAVSAGLEPVWSIGLATGDVALG